MKLDAVFAQVSFQFCGHLDDYLIPRTRHLVLFYAQTRFGKGDHRVCRYEEGRLVEEKCLKSSGSIVWFYVRLFGHWLRELTRFCRGRENVVAIAVHPLLAISLPFCRRVTSLFWQWDYFPGRSMTEIEFDVVAWCAARLCSVYTPLTSRIAAAMGRDEAPLMLGMTIPETRKKTPGNRILMVGQLRRGQGVENLLDFLSKNPSYSLALVGASANGFGDEIRTRLIRDGLESRVSFSDRFVTDIELRDIASTCFVSMALYDMNPKNLTHFADPGKVKSSIEMGLPVVMTRISEIAPFVERYVAGEVVDSLEGLPQAIERIRTDYDRYCQGCQDFAAYFNAEIYYQNFFSKLSDMNFFRTAR